MASPDTTHAKAAATTGRLAAASTPPQLTIAQR